MKTIFSTALLVVATLLAGVATASAQNTSTQQPDTTIASCDTTVTTCDIIDDNVKTLLVINSYHEDELWSNRMTRPIEIFTSQADSIRCEKVYLNNSMIDNIDTYQRVCDNLFGRYADRHPAYVVLVGNFAFTLRDRIKQEWGDVPFILISRVGTYAPIDQYLTFTSDDDQQEENIQTPIGQLRDQYNFSAIIVPDFYQENIDLMTRLIPDMRDFVFVSDQAYVNKVAALNIESILKEAYPDINFRWLQASEQSGEELFNMFITPHPRTGILLSSWVYEITNTRGGTALTTRELSFVSISRNPVFTLRQTYMSLGCVGGAFIDNEAYADTITANVRAMVQGFDLRHIPFVLCDKPITSVNYNKMQEYGLDVEALDEETVILNEPKGYFERYGIIMIAVIFVGIIIILIMGSKNKSQRHRIDVLTRHNDFINNMPMPYTKAVLWLDNNDNVINMPMPYTKAVLWLDNNDNVININYELKNNIYEELISKNSMPDNPLHLFDNTYLSDIAHRLISTNEPVSIQHHFKRTGIYCYFIFVPLKDNSTNKKKNEETHGRRLDIDVFAIDITKDHIMQQQLKDQAVTIDISMEMAQLVPWQWDVVTDTLSFYTYRNNIGGNATTTRDGKSTSQMKFEDFLKLLPPADSEEMLKIYHSILCGDSSRLDKEFRMRRTDTDSEYDWCENHGVVTDTDSDGRPLRMTGSIQFITDRKRQQEEMSEALTKAKESDMLKSAFLANMSHEIRTPLNAIVGFSNLLTTTDDMQERAEFAEIINRNNELLLSLINDILDLAKIESNTITLTYDLCDIHDLVSSISKTVSIRVPKGVKLNVVHYADSCIVRADASHISQILINLLTNATKFTKRGSITVGYEIYEDENKLYFYVKDTGIGISQENIDKVFNRFVKLNNFVQGSGLGLAICRTLVEKMGGEIGVKSQGEGRGSTFWFTIPYDPMELKLDDHEERAALTNTHVSDKIVGQHADRPARVEQTAVKTFSQAALSAGNAGNPQQPSDPNIQFKTSADISNNSLASIPDGLVVLVAEDNPSNYWLMARLMQNKFQLHHAENGHIAVEMQQQVNPDIIIMDINMPEMDGYEAVAEMRKQGVTAPIIAVTAYAFASDRVRILSSGFDAFVSKPVSATILYDTINEVWERKQMKND